MAAPTKALRSLTLIPLPTLAPANTFLVSLSPGWKPHAVARIIAIHAGH